MLHTVSTGFRPGATFARNVEFGIYPMPDKRGLLLIMCDGENQNSNQTARARIYPWVLQAWLSGAKPDFQQVLKESFARIDRTLRYASTTATVAIMAGGQITGAHVGLSRAVVIGKGGVRQLTEDHAAAPSEERVRSLGSSLPGSYRSLWSSPIWPRSERERDWETPATRENAKSSRLLGGGTYRPLGAVSTPQLFTEPIGVDDQSLLIAPACYFDVISLNALTARLQGITRQRDVARLVDDHGLNVVGGKIPFILVQLYNRA